MNAAKKAPQTRTKPTKAAELLAPAATATPDAAPPMALGLRVVRGLLLFFAATLPLYFDLAVPEVSGDIRWMATSFFAGLTALLLLGDALLRGTATLSLRGPVWMWIAAGLCLWAAVSLIDALNWMRGIILLKALYAQILLAVVVWWVVKTARHDDPFPRRLLWALAAPLAVTAFIGILQFHGFNQDSFDAALANSPYVIFSPLLAVLGWMTSWMFAWVPAWPQTDGLVNQLMGYFLQSAVPGGSFANKNLAGSYTAMMLPLMVYLFFSARRWWEQGLAAGLLALGSLFLLYSRARASWLALIAATLVFAVVFLLSPALRARVRIWLRPQTLVWLVIPVFVLLRHGGDVSPVPGAYAVDRTPAAQLAALGNAQGGWNEYGGRLAYNLNSLAIIRDHWFNGVGLGSFFGIYPAYYSALVVTPTNSYNTLARPQRTHTDLMQAFDEMGIAGGLLYASMFILGIAMALRLAGSRAGALGGKVIGAGLLSAVFCLTLFLDMRGMMQLPGLWQFAFPLLLAAMIGALVLWALRDALALWQSQGTDTEVPEALDEWQVAGLFGGFALLTICLNAMMDFPMQLPTAPAAALMLIGLVMALHGRMFPTAWRAGPPRPLTLPRPALGAAMAALLAVWSWALWDAWAFRNGNILLKAAMVRIYSGVIDDTTKAIIDRANEVYALDPRIHEHMGVVYANYNGVMPLDRQTRIGTLEWVLKGDPWAANHLVNLAGQYIALIDEARARNDLATVQRALTRMRDIYARLQRVADFSHLTWGIGGLIAVIEDRDRDAIPLLQRALTIDPTYAPARNALQIAIARSGVSPIVIQDNAVKQAP